MTSCGSWVCPAAPVPVPGSPSVSGVSCQGSRSAAVAGPGEGGGTGRGTGADAGAGKARVGGAGAAGPADGRTSVRSGSGPVPVPGVWPVPGAGAALPWFAPGRSVVPQVIRPWAIGSGRCSRGARPPIREPRICVRSASELPRPRGLSPDSPNHPGPGAVIGGPPAGGKARAGGSTSVASASRPASERSRAPDSTSGHSGWASFCQFFTRAHFPPRNTSGCAYDSEHSSAEPAPTRFERPLYHTVLRQRM